MKNLRNNLSILVYLQFFLMVTFLHLYFVKYKYMHKLIPHPRSMNLVRIHLKSAICVQVFFHFSPEKSLKSLRCYELCARAFWIDATPLSTLAEILNCLGRTLMTKAILCKLVCSAQYRGLNGI